MVSGLCSRRHGRFPRETANPARRGSATAVNHPPSCCSMEPACPAPWLLAPAGHGGARRLQPRACCWRCCLPGARAFSLCGVRGAVCMWLPSRGGSLLACGHTWGAFLWAPSRGPSRLPAPVPVPGSSRRRTRTGVSGAMDEVLGAITFILKPVNPGELAEGCVRSQDPWWPALHAPPSGWRTGSHVLRTGLTGPPRSVLGSHARERTLPGRGGRADPPRGAHGPWRCL